MISVWIGTPNEMAKAASKPTQSSAARWARDYLEGMKVQARKYDNASLNHIQRVHDELGQATEIAQGDRRGWQFEYIGITFRIELRNT